MWIFLLALMLPCLVWFAVAWFSIRPPRAPLFWSPYDLDLPFETVQFPSRDGYVLRGWWLEAPNSRGVVVCCHGYLSNRCEVLGVAGTLRRAGFSVLTFDFRAHGKSQGTISTLGARESRDVQGALDWLETQAPKQKIALFGSSMGGATVIMTAAIDERVSVVATDCAYCDLQQAGTDWWTAAVGKKLGALLRPVSNIGALLAKTSLHDASPQKAIASIAPRPILLLHAQGDGLVPIRHARALYACAHEPKTLREFPGSGHVQIRADFPQDYYAALLPFFESWAQSRGI